MSKNILIIEDDRDILDIMIYILEDEGYYVIGAQDCAMITIKTVQGLKPSLILLDIRLPDGDGSEACKRLKENAKTAAIPVILVSANNKLEQMAAESRADGFLCKPFDVTELIALANLWA